MKEKLIDEIVSMEWEMFSAVQNVGGTAPCQEDKTTFEMMRAGQAEAWPEELLSSYAGDLKAAREQKRNLMTEKYAYMMESTFPDEYEQMKRLLPEVDDSKAQLIEEIVKIFVTWRMETSRRYPSLSQVSRAIHTYEDNPFQTSFETYLRGELKTFSQRTVELFFQMTQESLGAGINLEEAFLLNSVKKYGFDSLEQANEACW